MKTCSDIIRDLREDNDYTQSQISTLLGTTQQQYSKYENGTTEIPLRVLVLLADYYKVSADFLLSRTSPQTNGLVLLNKGEKKLLKNWSNLSIEQQELLLKLMETMG